MDYVALVLALSVAGCSGETTAPAPNPAPSSPTPEPTSSAPGFDAGAAPLIAQPLCSTWSEARPFRDEPKIEAWYEAPCPAGMTVTICGIGTDEELPAGCSWFDGQPYGMSPTCCPSDDVELKCKVDDDCPASGDECWRPFCNLNILGGMCMQTSAGLIDKPCGNGGVCRIGGMLRSELDGFLISEPGWPAVCDVPQWPE